MSPLSGLRGFRRWLVLAAGLWILFGGFPGRTAEAGPPSDGVTPTAAAQQDAAQQDADSQAADTRSADQAQDSADAAHEGEEEHLRVSKVFVILIFMLLFGKFFGEIAERNGQPAVLGELLAGVVLGSSVLGVIPETGAIYQVIHVFAEVGVSILLFEIGLETDLKEMFRVGPTASAVAMVGVFIPFGLGFLYWFLANPSIGVHPEGISFAIVAVFVGAALTATSVGITARVLSDLNQMHTPEARIIIGAAVIDDVLGIVILAVVSGLASGAAMTVLSIGRIFTFAVGFLILAVVLGNRLAPVLFDFVDRMRVRGVLLVTAICFALGVAALADFAGSAMIIGAFAAGLVLSSTNQFDAVVERVEPVADIFTPIFFVSVGAPVNVQLFVPGAAAFDIGVLVVGLILTVIAIIGKLVSGLPVSRKTADRVIVGVGMVPRGEVGLIFASIGLTSGILSGEVYSAILIMVILSTFLVPPILKQLFSRRPAEAPRVEAVKAEM